jgi:hypothetical protein
LGVNDEPVAAHATGERNLDGQLMGYALKEWLRRRLARRLGLERLNGQNG